MTVLSNRGRALVVAAVSAAFLLGVAIKLHAPLTFWDSALVTWALSAPSEAPTWTSPFYLLSMKFMAWAGVLDVPHVRWFNAMGGILSAFLVFRLAGHLWEGVEAPLVAISLYLLHPAIIQGTQSLDGADSSFFPGAFALWILVFLAGEREDWKRTVALSLASAWAIAWKTTSALALLLYPIVALVLRPREKRNLVAQSRDLLATLAGFALFAIPWWVSQYWGSLSVSLSSALSDITSRAGAATALRVTFHAALAAAWLGPFLLALAVWGAASLFRRGNLRVRAVVVSTAVYVLAYLLAGGMNHGYPRYHVAVLPIICAISAAPVSPVFRNRQYWLATLLVTIAFWATVGDPIYRLNLKAREAAFSGTLGPLITSEAFHLMAWVAIPVVVQLVLSLSWQRTLLLAAWASSIALGIRQSSAAYVTAYSYGEEGRGEVLEWIDRAVPTGGSVLSPPNITAELWKKEIRAPSHRHWQTKESVSAFIEQAGPRAVILGLAENTDWQLKWLLEDPPPPLQACRDRYTRIGTYWVCDPRKPPSAGLRRELFEPDTNKIR